MTEPAQKKEAEIVRCWTTIGIAGDMNCERLKEFVHCRNCPLYAEEGRRLLDREPPEHYLDEWGEVLAIPVQTDGGKSLSLVVFRVGQEWLALRTTVFQKIAPVRPAHVIPHRSGRVVLGMANVDGELLLCASLAGLMQIESARAAEQQGADVLARLVVAGAKEDIWAFPVDAVDGIYSVNERDIQAVPVTILKSNQSYTEGLVTLAGRAVALLSEQRIFESLRNRISR